MTRPTTTIDLINSGKKAEVITYFTRGERIEIEKIILEGAVMKGSEPELNISNTLKAKDRTIEIAVRNMTIEEINDLPEDDAKYIQDHIDSLSSSKKK